MAGWSSQLPSHSPALLAETATHCLRTDAAQSHSGRGQAGDVAAPLEGQRENPPTPSYTQVCQNHCCPTYTSQRMAGPSSLHPLVSGDPSTHSAKLHVHSWTVPHHREQNPTATSCLLEQLQCGVHVPPQPLSLEPRDSRSPAQRISCTGRPASPLACSGCSASASAK